MEHQFHLENTKYRQWVKAGLGLTYLREGLSPFCEDIAKQQHNDILDKIKQTKNLSAVACGKCSWSSLTPDHAGKKSCKYGQRNCNCCNPAGKISCSKQVCGAIYDEILNSHGFTPPAPYWKNTETQHWCTDPWSIAKCFINAPGYERKASAADIDCIGLLHLIRNNLYFHDHIQCKIAQTDVFSKVITDRNEIFHSSTMQIEEADANNYIDDMITVLQDGKELYNRQDAQNAVKKLLELKKHNFIITTKSEADVVHAAIQSVLDTIKDFKDKLQEKLENVPTTEDVVNNLREKLANVPTTEGFENKLRDNLANVPTTEYVESLGTRVTNLELNMAALKEEIKELKAAKTSQGDQYKYIKSKLEFQERLMTHYRQYLLKVSPIPMEPDRNHCYFSEVYVRPQMTLKTSENRRLEETEIESMSEIFTKAGTPMRSIYVLGDAGSGKSSFCKSLVNCWCMAHSGELTVGDEFDGIKEMRKFEFLLYIALRRFRGVVSIQEMLEKQYEKKILNEILNKQSRNIIIVLDGLDEWSCTAVTFDQFQTEGLPKRDMSKDYTVITTSRPWKIETLRVPDPEIEQRLKLQGFNRSSVKTMIDKTVSVLNKLFAENKSPSACEDTLNNETIDDMKEVPIMLLQLICLWFDGKLQVSSRCAVYSGMLELFFCWNDRKKKDEEEERLFREIREMSKDLQNIELPQYVMNNKLCKMYKYLIHKLSRLAYETLFTNEKEASLTFDSSVLEELEISDEVKTSCLKLGILSEDACPSLCASTSDSQLFSFVHKSVQEYLAAVYIAIKFKARTGSSADSENQDFSGAPLMKEVFSNIKTLNEILEQANVFIMLCGLEPRIATSVSNFIYDIVTRDKRILEYRRTIDHKHRSKVEMFIIYIQNCILNCIKEAKACQTSIQFNFYVGDIAYVRLVSYYCTDIDKQYISHDSVRSFEMYSFFTQDEDLATIFRFLLQCRRLDKIHIIEDAFSSLCRHEFNDECINSICRVIENNTSTLKSLFVRFTEQKNLENLYETIVCLLPNMSHLIALNIEGETIKHQDFHSLCTFLSGSRHLKQISICFKVCKSSTFHMCMDQHEVDLSKHQLEYLQYGYSVAFTQMNTSNLEELTCLHLNSSHSVKVFDNFSTANSLSHLNLTYDRETVLDHAFVSGENCLYHTVTNKLIKVLPLLHQLREVMLEDFILTDNIIKCPSEMKSMKSINLIRVRMSLSTWRQFVDSLPLMPLPVEVKTVLMCIRDGEECNRKIDWNTNGGEEAAAWQYIREREELFNADFKYETLNSFSTRK